MLRDINQLQCDIKHVMHIALKVHCIHVSSKQSSHIQNIIDTVAMDYYATKDCNNEFSW